MQHSGTGRGTAQGAQRGQILRAGVVPGGQGVLEQLQIAGGGARERFAVAGEIGMEERSQPAGLADRLVQGIGQTQTVLDVLVGERGRVEGDGEGTSEHTQLVCAERHSAAGSVWRGHGPTIPAKGTKSG